MSAVRGRAGFRRCTVMPIVAAVLLVAACDGSGSGSARSGGIVATTGRIGTVDVPLPEGDEPVVVAPWGDDLLVGSRAPQGSSSRPRLTVLRASGGTREVPVTPVSPTAFQA